MKWLDKEIVLDTISIDIAVLIFSILSLFCSIITIIIYLKVNSLRTIIYRLFFQIAINETISRTAHILEFINNNLHIKFTLLFDINTILIYFTDTNILIFISYSCYSMFELIIKQNKKINNQFAIFLYITYIISFLLTGLFYFLSYFCAKGDNRRKNELYKNIIALIFIKDNDKEGKTLYPLLITSIIYFFLVVYAFIKVILIQIFIKKRGGINDVEEGKNEDKKIQKSLKLKSFKNKMMQYPLLGLFFFCPLTVYAYIEYGKGDEDEEKLKYLQIRYIFYNIYCFMNSIRGWMFFRVFISNEKIKLFLFKNYLTSSVFYTIDKINLKRERRISTASHTSNTSLTNNELFTMESSFDSYLKKNKSVGITNKNNIDEDEEEKFIGSKDKSFDGNINNSEEESDSNSKKSHDAKSESLKVKGNI